MERRSQGPPGGVDAECGEVGFPKAPAPGLHLYNRLECTRVHYMHQKYAYVSCILMRNVYGDLWFCT